MFNLEVIGWIIRSLSVFLAIALVVIFQPELRRALTDLGSHPFFTSAFEKRETIEDITDTVFELSSKGFGALLAVEREIGLQPFTETGVQIDADYSKELVLTIFQPKTVLHDGGMVVRMTASSPPPASFPHPARRSRPQPGSPPPRRARPQRAVGLRGDCRFRGNRSGFHLSQRPP